MPPGPKIMNFNRFHFSKPQFAHVKPGKGKHVSHSIMVWFKRGPMKALRNVSGILSNATQMFTIILSSRTTSCTVPREEEKCQYEDMSIHGKVELKINYGAINFLKSVHDFYNVYFPLM